MVPRALTRCAHLQVVTASLQYIPNSKSKASRTKICSTQKLLSSPQSKIYILSEKVSLGRAEGMACMVAAREGRQLQRYNSHGGRQVVGCIPYRLKSRDEDVGQSFEVLVISSQKGDALVFPKGGWESDESIREAASREALEEAGVQGKLEDILGKWKYKSKRYGTLYEGFMFPLNVTEELEFWPEMEARKRKWITITEAREGCRDLWMREALEVLILRLSHEREQFRT